MADNDALPPPAPYESIVEYFFRMTVDLTPDGRQRVLDALMLGMQARRARLEAAAAIEKAMGS